MTIGEYYLKPNVVFEPLIDNWYAWSHLIAPATAAMNIKGRHLKIINSFLQAPHIHAAAVKNPKMRGGPFMDYDERYINAIRAMLEVSVGKNQDLIDLANAIVILNDMLLNKADGYSLQHLYDEIPQILRGYVELVYDLNNKPTFRLFEHLLYRSKFYKQDLQNIALWLTDNDERPFVLSTPRLAESKDCIRLEMPFASPLIDDLSKMRRKPGSIQDISEKLGIKNEQAELFKSFFHATPPPKYNRYTGNLIRTRYFGHACILVETADVSILVDPLISYYGYPPAVEHFSDMNLPEKIDYVLITHNHQDHILFETLLPLRHKIGKIIVPSSTSGALQDPNLKLIFNNIGFSNVVEIDCMETITFGDCEVTGVPFLGEHSDLNIHSKTCYHLRFGDFTMLFVSDSCNMDPVVYDHVHRETGDVSVIFLGMECDGAPLSWLYGPLLSQELERDKDNSRRLSGSNFEQGKALIEVFNPKELYIYAMGQEPWVEFISSIKYTEASNPIIASNRLLEFCKSRDIVAERLFGEKELLYPTVTASIG